MAFQRPECLTGIVYEYENSREYQHDEVFICCHELTDQNEYAVYEVKVNRSCDSYPYEYTKHYEEYFLKKCTGR